MKARPNNPMNRDMNTVACPLSLLRAFIDLPSNPVEHESQLTVLGVDQAQASLSRT